MRTSKIFIFFRADSDIFSCNLQPLKKRLSKKSRSQSLTKLLEVIYLSVVKLYFSFSDAATPRGTNVSQYLILKNLRIRTCLCVSVSQLVCFQLYVCLCMFAYVCLRIFVSIYVSLCVYTYVFFSFLCICVVFAQGCFITVTSVFQHVSLLRDYTLLVYPTKYHDHFRLKQSLFSSRKIWELPLS